MPKDATPTALKQWGMKVLHVKNALQKEKIIVAVDTQMQAAVVGAKVGEGFVAYTGDVNSWEESDTVILLSLCGL